ncbi:MAG: transcriptional regulator [Rhodothermales bacterium]
MTDVFHFDDHELDVPNRRLSRDGRPVELNARYFDALVLLVRAQGQLIPKDRFFEEVWGEVVVSDSALTQCIKDIRKALGDDSSNPRYVQTVPRHGYRFMAEVRAGAPAANGTVQVPADAPTVSVAATELFAGTVGGGVAGICGGLLYGFALTNASGSAELGTLSILLVMMTLTGFLGVLGGFGVSMGLAVSGWLAARQRAARPWAWRIAGAALGGLLVGSTTKLLGLDAFNLLLGRTPAGMTGGIEGACLGAALAAGAWLGGGFQARKRWHPVAAGAATGCAAGVLITLAGGRLLGGSLQLLADSFSQSRLELDALGRFFGELQFGTFSQVALGGLEGGLFGAGVIGALVLASALTQTHRQRHD